MGCGRPAGGRDELHGVWQTCWGEGTAAWGVADLLVEGRAAWGVADLLVEGRAAWGVADLLVEGRAAWGVADLLVEGRAAWGVADLLVESRAAWYCWGLSSVYSVCVRYLEGCLMAIDDQDSLVRSHLAEVLGGLTEALKAVEANLAPTQPAKVRWEAA